MAHILIGWELGANRGHALRLAMLGHALRDVGHQVSFAVQRIDALSEAEAGGSPVWQAPLTPRLLTSGSRFGGAMTLGMADILARLGMDDDGIVTAMIGGWRQLFGAIRPDIVIAEYAPYLLLAARGRLPAIAIGTAFSQPPTDMARLPELLDGTGGVDQGAMLATINRALASKDTAQLDALAQIFAAERTFADSFAELDPYAAHRTETLANPVAGDFAARVGSGEEIFVYAPERIAPDAPLWGGLKASGLPVRVHAQRASSIVLGALGEFGFMVEAEPIDIETIAARSRLVVSHGGHGFACAAMAAGLPHVVCHHDLEKLLIGLAVTTEGLGGHVSLGQINPERFGADLTALYRDDELAERSRSKADELAQRGQPDFKTMVVEAVTALT